MRQPSTTRATLLAHAGALFNTQGYRATSLSDITSASGLTKGAIYAHFADKGALELEAFDHMAALVLEQLATLVKAQPSASAKLRAVFRFFEAYIYHPIVVGGCPLQNAAIEADDANPQLREHANAMQTALRNSIERILYNGIKHGQLRAELNVPVFAVLILASMEGAVMMSRLTGSNADMRTITTVLDEQLRSYELHNAV